MKRYNGIEEDPYGVYVLYTDAVKMQRKAFVTGWCDGYDAGVMDESCGIVKAHEPDAIAARLYKEE